MSIKLYKDPTRFYRNFLKNLTTLWKTCKQQKKDLFFFSFFFNGAICVRLDWQIRCNYQCKRINYTLKLLYHCILRVFLVKIVNIWTKTVRVFAMTSEAHEDGLYKSLNYQLYIEIKRETPSLPPFPSSCKRKIATIGLYREKNPFLSFRSSR